MVCETHTYDLKPIAGVDVFQSMATLKANLHKHWKNILLLLFLLITGYYGISGFLEITSDMRERDFEAFDEKMASIALAFRNDVLTSFFRTVARFGDWYVYVALFAVFTLVFYKNRQRLGVPALGFAVISIAAGAMFLMKEVFDRDRPTLHTLVDATNPGYPSGHAMLSVIFYGFLLFLGWKLVRRMWTKILLTVAVVLLVTLICFSRVYLGAHFASDVIAGLVAGIGWLAMAMLVYVLIRFLKSGKAL